MSIVYLVTGATGFLGHFVVRKLLSQGKEVVGLRLAGDKQHLIEGASYEVGDVTRPFSLKKFFDHATGREAFVLHCAGLVSIESQNPRLWRVNVDGTRNILDWCVQSKIKRMVYVSSVHAIEEKPMGQIIHEPVRHSASLVEGAYAKSKAEATYAVQRASRCGLDASIVYPSGIIGPEDYAGGYMTETIRAYLKGIFPVAVGGGYDFVDVRDVADGILACAEKGRCGEGYILSGRYITVNNLFGILAKISNKKLPRYTVPLNAIRWAAPACEIAFSALRVPQLVTPYSLRVLASNGAFSHEKAAHGFGYEPRAIEKTLADTAAWVRSCT